MTKKEAHNSIIRSSAAEYLTFLATHGESGVEAVYADQNIWLTQKMMSALYDVEPNTVNYHLKKIFLDSELNEEAVIRNFRITATDGKSYDTKHYSLSAIIAVGYKVNSERAVQFRKWATLIIEEFTIKGFVMDDERLKNDGSILGKQYFEEQLQRIREIRLSERKFYQKITDIYATAIDYDVNAQVTKRFFATVQNKLHWAIHANTAAEVIYTRANAEKENMGLTHWKDAPSGKIQKFDVSVAKNYLTENEVSQLARIVSAYLDVAEDMALRKIPMSMQDWEIRLNRFIEATDREILKDAGRVTAEIAKSHAESEFEKYRIIQDQLFESDFDRLLKKSSYPLDNHARSATVFRVGKNSADLKKCLEIRRTVFIDGQKVPEALENDGLDEASVHYLLVLNRDPIGTARVRQIDTKAKIERVAILPTHQGYGFGQQLMQFIIEDIKHSKTAKKITVSSQIQAIPFYAGLGFVVCSAEYREADILHKDMEMLA